MLLPLCGVLLLLLVAARLLTGPSLFDDNAALLWPVLEIRGQRVAVAAAVGSALALAGLLLQALVRNPLASPDLVGASAGAGLALLLGTLLAGVLALPAGLANAIGSRLVLATVGALAALLLVATFARAERARPAPGGPGGRASLRARLSALVPARIDPTALVLGGVMISIIAGSLTTMADHLMQSLGLPRAADLGGLLLGTVRDDVGWTLSLAVLAAALLIAFAWSAKARLLDAMLLPEQDAAALGVPVGSVRAALFVSAGGLSAAAVVLAGPISFIGLLAPHFARFLDGAGRGRAGGEIDVSPRHSRHIWLCIMLGPMLVIGADITARLIDFGSGRIPTGALTSIVGGTVFLILLARGRR